jgi:hypothetical protein
LDHAVIKEREAQIKLKVTEEKMKAQEQQLESTQMVMSKQEFSSSAVISLAVANAMAPVKNHMLEFNAEILRKDFTVDDAGYTLLVDSAYDTAQHFVSLYDFSVLADSNGNASPSAL